MSLIGKNIRKIRTVKKLSQADFAQLFNLARPSIGAYEEGRSEPKIETLIQIAQYFALSIDALLTKELTINELYQFDIFSKTNTTSQVSSKITDADILYVAREFHLEYIVQKDNKDFLNQLPIIKLPIIQKEKLRAFENYEPYMYYNGIGIHPGDILISKQLTADNFSKLQPDYYYVLITEEGVLVRKLVQYTESGIELGLIHPDYKNEIVPVEKILECWEVFMTCTTSVYTQNSFELRLEKLEKQVFMLMHQKNQS